MKKFLTLILALVMVLAIAAPAMAFTSDTELDATEDTVFELDIYLVDYDEGVFGMGAYLPQADRGYAKNEIVAAVVELTVPEDFDFGAGATIKGYEFAITGENVAMEAGTDQESHASAALDADLSIPAVDNVDFPVNANKDVTYKWLVFGKVTGDEASITAKLKDAANEMDLEDGDTVPFTSGDHDFEVDYAAGVYTIAVSNPAIANLDSILVNVSTKTSEKWDGKSIQIVSDFAAPGTDATYTVDFYLNGDIFFKNAATAVIVTADSLLEDHLIDIYEDVVVGEIGLDATLDGKVKPSYFEAMQDSNTAEATVDIEPWTAYVSVPDNIVVDPPKTGDAASILGFVMIVLAAAAVVAVRKVRA